jgi:hypothetical protein
MKRQFWQVYDLMCDRQWRTLAEIRREIGAKETSIAAISARLRDCRKRGFQVDCRRLNAGLFHYRLIVPPTQKRWQVGLENAIRACATGKSKDAIAENNRIPVCTVEEFNLAIDHMMARGTLTRHDKLFYATRKKPSP